VFLPTKTAIVILFLYEAVKTFEKGTLIYKEIWQEIKARSRFFFKSYAKDLKRKRRPYGAPFLYSRFIFLNLLPENKVLQAKAKIGPDT